MQGGVSLSVHVGVGGGECLPQHLLTLSRLQHQLFVKKYFLQKKSSFIWAEIGKHQGIGKPSTGFKVFHRLFYQNIQNLLLLVFLT